MTETIRVGQIWERRKDGRLVTVTHVSPANLLELTWHDTHRTSHPMACTLRTDYQLVKDVT